MPSQNPDSRIRVGSSPFGDPSSKHGQYLPPSEMLVRQQFLDPATHMVNKSPGNTDTVNLTVPTLQYADQSSISASPARFYVSMIVKMILIQFLTRYDFKLADENVPPAFMWGVARIPHPRLTLLIRKRAV